MSWLPLRVPFEASVASVTARFNRLVTCARAPSATSRRPTPSVALVSDWVRACEFALRPSTSESPAASSAPELIFDPDDNCCRTVFRLFVVLFRLFSAYIAERLFRTPRDMGFSLSMRGFAAPTDALPILLATLGCCFRSGYAPHLAPSSAWQPSTLAQVTSLSSAGQLPQFC